MQTRGNARQRQCCTPVCPTSISTKGKHKRIRTNKNRTRKLRTLSRILRESKVSCNKWSVVPASDNINKSQLSAWTSRIIYLDRAYGDSIRFNSHSSVHILHLRIDTHPTRWRTRAAPRAANWRLFSCSRRRPASQVHTSLRLLRT